MRECIQVRTWASIQGGPTIRCTLMSHARAHIPELAIVECSKTHTHTLHVAIHDDAYVANTCIYTRVCDTVCAVVYTNMTISTFVSTAQYNVRKCGV